MNINLEQELDKHFSMLKIIYSWIVANPNYLMTRGIGISKNY